MLARDLNDQTYLRGDLGCDNAREIEIACECERRNCPRRLRISRERYNALRQFPTRFVMKPGHPADDNERVIDQQDGFVIVEKTGPPALIAIRLDPRKRRQNARLAS